MTLATSGAISLGGSTATRSINLELGQSATAQVSMNDTNVRTLAGVSSGAIVMPTNFYGKSAGATIVLSNQSIADFTGGGSTASAGYQLTSAGAANEIVGASTSFLQTWCSPSGEAVNYEVYVTVTGSPLTIGFVNAWTALSTTRTWRLDAGIGQNLFTTLSVQVRRVGTTTPVYSATIDLNADASF
jgi:hypothetical protein